MKMRQANEFKKIMRHIAYDYYPFGMLMPNRYTEDNTIQCTPITKTVYTPQWINTLSLTLANPAQISAFDIFPASTTASIILTQQKLKVVASTSYADISQVSILVSNGIEAFKPVKLQCSVNNNNLADYVSVSLQQENANNEWETFASTTVAKNATLELTGTPTSNTALKVVYEGIHADFNIGNIGLQRQDMLSSTEIVQICNSDEFSRDYRFGFNGQEKDNEIKGAGNSLDFGARIYDSKLGTWLSVDKYKKPHLSSYQFGGGNPIAFVDPDGNTEYYYNGKHVGSDGGRNNMIGLVKSKSIAKAMEKGKYNYPESNTITNGTSNKDMFAIDANVLSVASRVSDLSLTKEGANREYRAGMNPGEPNSGFQMSDNGIEEGMPTEPWERATTKAHGKDGKVNIHSHPTGFGLYKGLYYSSAAVPSTQGEENDKTNIENEYDMSIIVGKDREIVTQTEQAMDGKIHTVPVTKDYRDDVINIYNNKNASTPAKTLKANEAKQILDDFETR